MSVDALRRRIRRGTLKGKKETEPPYRWLVAVPGTATTVIGPPPSERIEQLEAENARLRGDLANARENERKWHAANEATHTNFALALRMLPPPARADPPRRRWRWPWRRTVA